MAKTVRDAFEQYKSCLEITDRQEALVTTTRDGLVRNIKRSLFLDSEEAKVIGSWDRNTLTRYLREGDVDVMVIMNYLIHANLLQRENPRACLNRFRDILLDCYVRSPIRVDQNCVTIKFTEFRLDVVPAFRTQNGQYVIPDTIKGTWIETNPFTFASYITQLNKNMYFTFVPLIKMVKGWNREVGWPIKSFHLECLLYNHCKTFNGTNSYSSMLRSFFVSLPIYLRMPTCDPVRLERVDLYLEIGNNRSNAYNKAIQASTTAYNAYNYELVSAEAAIMNWHSIMGEFFPAYG